MFTYSFAPLLYERITNSRRKIKSFITRIIKILFSILYFIITISEVEAYYLTNKDSNNLFKGKNLIIIPFLLQKNVKNYNFIVFLKQGAN